MHSGMQILTPLNIMETMRQAGAWQIQRIPMTFLKH